MIVEQIAPAGPTAWLAAVGLAHLTKEPLDAVEVALLASDGKQVPSVSSRWVKTGTAWSLEIDAPPADFAALLGWYADRFDAWRTGVEAGNGPTVGRDPWWRMRGNASVDGITDFSFTVHRGDYQKAMDIAKSRKEKAAKKKK